MPPSSFADALTMIESLQRQLAEANRKAAWSTGARGDGAMRADGFTVAETRILRVLASTGEIHYDHFDSLQRHMSNIRIKLRKMGLIVDIKTIVQVGYEVTKGKAVLERLVAGARVTATKPSAMAKIAARFFVPYSTPTFQIGSFA